jgi:peptidoglycan DL-endopeptidase CwlO
MNRTLTAAVALATALGMAGLAHAQSSTAPSPSTQMTPPAAPNTMPSPQTTAPSSSMDQSGQQTSQSQILQAQQALKSQGLYRGAIDGVDGPEMHAAVTQFQRQQGLPQTAQLDQQTLERLNGSNTGGSQSSTTRSPLGAQSPTTPTSR